MPIGEFPRGFVVEYERVHLVRSPDPERLARWCATWFAARLAALAAALAASEVSR